MLLHQLRAHPGFELEPSFHRRDNERDPRGGFRAFAREERFDSRDRPLGRWSVCGGKLRFQAIQSLASARELIPAVVDVKRDDLSKIERWHGRLGQLHFPSDREPVVTRIDTALQCTSPDRASHHAPSRNFRHLARLLANGEK